MMTRSASGAPTYSIELVLATGDFGEVVHGLLQNARDGSVEGIDGFAGLEVDIGILGGAAQHRTVRGKRAQAVLADKISGQHGAHIVDGELLYLGDFMRGAEAIEEVHEGHARFQSCSLGDQSGVHDFLDIVGRQQRPAGLADSHDILMIAEDGQALGGDGTGRDMDDAGAEFAGDLVHVGDHEQQTLRGGEGRSQASTLQSSMHGADCAAFTLHLHHVRNRAPDIGLAIRGVLVTEFAHWGRGSDGIDSYDFVSFMRDIGGSFVAVDGHFCATHESILQEIAAETNTRRSGRRMRERGWAY